MLDNLIKVNEALKDCQRITNIVSENLQVNGYQILQSELADKMHKLNKAIDALNDNVLPKKVEAVKL